MKKIIEKIKKSKSMSGVVRMVNKDENILNFIVDYTRHLNDVSINERIFNIKYNILEIPICPICNINKLKWDHKYKYYKKTCVNKVCKSVYFMINRDSEKEKIRRKKIKETHKNKTYDEKQIIVNKIKATNIKKYGYDSYSKTLKFKNSMIEKFGCVSPFGLKETHDKSKKTLMKKYGCDHNFKMNSVKIKKKITFLNKYGVDNPTKNQKIKEKIIKTNNKKYGGNSPMCNVDIKEKSKNTLFLNYGVDTPLKNKEILKKYENTMLKLYGVKYWIQDSDNLEKMKKNRKTTYKKYILESGEIIYLQGYEDYVLYEILLKKYSIFNICIKNKSIEKYTNKIIYEIDNVSHRYYPDFFIVSENKIVEVKSEYTYNVDIKINKLKMEACLDKGLNFEFIIIDNKTYKKWKIETKNNKNK